MSLISKEEAQAVLGPYHNAFASGLRAAFLSWQQHPAPWLPFFRLRTQANYVQDAAETELRSQLGSDPKVLISKPKQDRFWMLIKNKGTTILIRIKKLNEKFKTSNVRTPTAEMFDSQEQLPNVPDAPRLTLGYRLNDSGTQFLGIWVALFVGADEQWRYELTVGPDGVTTIATEPPELPLPAVGLKLKPDAKKKKKKDGDGS